MNDKLVRISRSDWLVVFLFFANLSIALSFAWRAVPFSLPDEGAHFLRAYEVSRGHFFNRPGDDGVLMPCDDYLVIGSKYSPIAFFEDVSQRLVAEGEACKVRSRNSAGIYSPVPYVASALGIRAAESLELQRPEDQLIAARVANVLLGSVILYTALLLFPIGRWALLYVMWLPFTVMVRSSVSADAVTLTSIAVFIAIALSYSAKPRGAAYWLFASVLAFVIGACKIVYGPVSLLMLFATPAQRSSLWRGSLGALVVAVSLGSSLLWYPKVGVYIGNGAIPAEQLAFLMDGVGNLPHVLWKTFAENWPFYLVQMVMPGALGNQPFALPLSLALFGGLFAISAATATRRDAVSNMLILGLALVVLVMISLPLYFVYTPVGGTRILGLQGRYFLPSIMLLVIAVGLRREQVCRADHFKWLVLAPAASTSWVAFQLL
ncbi:DUF2142 domain-containing protein [Aminobacter sp. LjRoot7]|uniref:DUF2142 domain-containing protein n=1 Tax=Aminobacter sp. LjRoot7 TaxID=3342335 RepID=UPI003ECFD83E